MPTTRRDFLSASTATAARAVTVPAATGAAPRTARWMPKLSENLADVNPDTLRWLKQLGCKHVIFQGTDGVDTDRKGYWTAGDVRAVRKACEAVGLVLESMMIPIDFYLQARLGKPGRDKDIENVCRTIRAAGEEGLPMMEWRFWPDFYWDGRVGYSSVEGRGGARYKAFDYDRVRKAPPFPEIGEVSAKEMWARFLHFAKPIVAAAEKANVRLTMHPNDPPVPVMRGVARIFHHRLRPHARRGGRHEVGTPRPHLLARLHARPDPGCQRDVRVCSRRVGSGLESQLEPAKAGTPTPTPPFWNRL